MNRRDFLSALGFGGGATALAACGYDDNRYYTAIEQILPYVTRPEQTTPGVNYSYATTIGTGPRAWPVVAVHRDGRVINLGANREAPVPGGVTGAQLLELQREYSPDRVRAPRGAQGDLTWDAGLAALAAAVSAARERGQKVAYLGPYRSGTMAELLQAFTGGNALFWEAVGYEAEALAARAMFGPEAGLPRYEIGEARYILSFGAQFLGDAWGTVGTRTAFAAARHPENGGAVARFVHVGPFRDQTAANADEWLACTPGTEAQVAMAIARSVAEMRAYAGPARAMLDTVDIDAVAQASGVSRATIQNIASLFSGGGALALPGGSLGATQAATELAAAVYTLNMLADQPHLFRAGGYQGPIATYADLDRLMAEMEAGAVGALLLDDVDPTYVLPNGLRFAEAMKKVPLTVALSSHPSETASLATMALPTHALLEDWGDEEPWAGFRLIRQPGMRPLYDTRPLGDVVLETWRAVDAANAPRGTWVEFLRARWAALYATVTGGAAGLPPAGEAPEAALAAGGSDPSLDTWWERVLVTGFVQTPSEARLELTGAVPTGAAPAPRGNGAFFLEVFPHPYVLDGRYANEPWAWEVVDPMTGQVWDTWALVNPVTAAELGLEDNDLIRITTDSGSFEIGVEVYPLIRPDTIAIPMGGGHTVASGRYADGVGQNVARLLGAVQDASGAFAWQQTRCAIEVVGQKADLVSLYGNDTDEGRRFAVVVDAAKWAEVRDEPQEHPGNLTGIHHLAMDPRLVAQEHAYQAATPTVEPEHLEYTNFYPVPDHPTYRFAMTIDTNACNGCGACMIACYAENNLPVVGKWKLKKRRQMSWIRLDRFYGEHTEDGSASVHFIPVPCQQCGKAPCESVCPVLATYHSIDGLNAMVYNRCVGTRYCANACPYSARRFNYHTYEWPEPFNLQLNPDVSARTMGVMEKCTFCVQRLRNLKTTYRERGFTKTIPNEALEQITACAEVCPSQAIRFGNLLDPASIPNKTRKSGRNYLLLADLGTFPAINYLARASFYVHDSVHGHEATEATNGPAHHEAGDH